MRAAAVGHVNHEGRVHLSAGSILRLFTRLILKEKPLTFRRPGSTCIIFTSGKAFTYFLRHQVECLMLKANEIFFPIKFSILFISNSAYR